MLQTVSKIGPVLDLFTVAQPEWGASEVAHALAIPKSSAHALLVTLSEIGLLQVSGRGRYRLGWKIMALGETLRTGLYLMVRQHARPLMEDFVRNVGETIQLGVLDRTQVLCVDSVVAHHPVTVSGPRVGMRLSAHSSALGKALLAHRYDDDGLRSAMSCTAPGVNAAASAGLAKLGDELAAVRRSGLAFEHCEALEDVCGVAGCITDPSGFPLAAVGTITLASRFGQRQVALERAVRGLVRRISRGLAEYGSGSQRPIPDSSREHGGTPMLGAPSVAFRARPMAVSFRAQ